MSTVQTYWNYSPSPSTSFPGRPSTSRSLFDIDNLKLSQDTIPQLYWQIVYRDIFPEETKRSLILDPPDQNHNYIFLFYSFLVKYWMVLEIAYLVHVSYLLPDFTWTLSHSLMMIQIHMVYIFGTFTCMLPSPIIVQLPVYHPALCCSTSHPINCEYYQITSKTWTLHSYNHSHWNKIYIQTNTLTILKNPFWRKRYSSLNSPWRYYIFLL